MCLYTLAICYLLGMNKINFGELLLKGSASYDSQVADWWLHRANDSDHQEAYRNIAELLFARLKLDQIEPQFIVDYACGGGHLFPYLQRLFPQSTIIGIDGSRTLLEGIVDHLPEAQIVDASEAFSQGGPKLRLVQSGLPNFDDFEAHKADAVLLCFPNLLPDEALLEVFNQHGYGHAEDNEVAHCLSRFQEMDPELRGEVEDPEEVFDELMSARVFSRNLHHLLKNEGLLLRVEYSNCHRSELSQLNQLKSFFMEGALEEEVHDETSELFFTYRESYYTDSPVILDVYHQTQDLSDCEGGYCVHFFQAEDSIYD